MVGDPAAAWLTEKTAGNPDIRAKIIQEHHLDEPLVNQYYYYIVDLSHLDLGNTGRQYGGRPVSNVLFERFPATFELSMVAMVMCLIIGIPLGIISAVKKDKWADHFVRLFSLIGVSMPVFWFGLILQLFFAYQFKILPLDARFDSIAWGIEPPAKVTGLYLIDSLFELNLDKFFISLKHLILPAFSLAYIYVAIIARMMRSSMLEAMTQDFIRTARAKGLSEASVILKHGLRNAMIPTTTVAGLAFGGLLAGAVMTETIYSWPGIGRFSVDAIAATDFASIMGFTLLIVFLYVFSNLLVDILYTYLDPRVKYG